MADSAREPDTYANQGERGRRLSNSLPVVGRALAEKTIADRRLEEAAVNCWTAPGWPNGTRYTHHLYVRALFGILNAGGTMTAVVVCGRCGHGRQSVGHRALVQHDILPTELPLLADLRRDYCERCGAIGAQLHHMAPRAIFNNDADSWPLAFLCQTCHSEWHRKMKTP